MHQATAMTPLLPIGVPNAGPPEATPRAKAAGVRSAQAWRLILLVPVNNVPPTHRGGFVLLALQVAVDDVASDGHPSLVAECLQIGADLVVRATRAAGFDFSCRLPPMTLRRTVAIPSSSSRPISCRPSELRSKFARD